MWIRTEKRFDVIEAALAVKEPQTRKLTPQCSSDKVKAFMRRCPSSGLNRPAYKPRGFSNFRIAKITGHSFEPKFPALSVPKVSAVAKALEGTMK